MIPPVKNRIMTSYGGIIRTRSKGSQPNDMSFPLYNITIIPLSEGKVNTFVLTMIFDTRSRFLVYRIEKKGRLWYNR